MQTFTQPQSGHTPVSPPQPPQLTHSQHVRLSGGRARDVSIGKQALELEDERFEDDEEELLDVSEDEEDEPLEELDAEDEELLEGLDADEDELLEVELELDGLLELEEEGLEADEDELLEGLDAEDDELLEGLDAEDEELLEGLDAEEEELLERLDAEEDELDGLLELEDEGLEAEEEELLWLDELDEDSGTANLLGPDAMREENSSLQHQFVMVNLCRGVFCTKFLHKLTTDSYTCLHFSPSDSLLLQNRVHAPYAD